MDRRRRLQNEITPLRLRENISWTLIANALTQAAHAVALVITARLTDPTVVGQYALALAICTPVMTVSMLELANVQATDANGEFRFSDFFILRCVTTAIATIAIWIIGLLVDGDASTRWVIAAMALVKGVDAFADIVSGFYQKIERMNEMARASGLRAIVGISSFAIILYVSRSLPIALTAQGVAMAAVVWGRDLRLIASLGGGSALEGTTLGVAKELLARAAPLAVGGGLASFTAHLPHYAIQYFHGEEALGYFASALYLTFIGRMVVGSAGRSARPRLARLWIGDRVAFRKTLSRLVLGAAIIGVAGTLLTIFLGDVILALVYGPEYRDYDGVLAWLTFASGLFFVAMMYEAGLMAAHAYRGFMAIQIGMTIATVVGCLALVPRYSIYGAAGAVMVSYVTKLAYAVILARRLDAKEPGRSVVPAEEGSS